MSSDELRRHVLEMAKKARAASYETAALSSSRKNDVLKALAKILRSNSASIVEARSEERRVGK
jgi:gamma-glutamyl phosphate reductase